MAEGAIERARASKPPRHFSRARLWLRHRAVMPARPARRESSGALATPGSTTFPRRAWGNQPPWAGADQQRPVGAPPPDKSQNLASAVLAAADDEPSWLVQFDRLAVRLPRKKRIRAWPRGQFLKRFKGIWTCLITKDGDGGQLQRLLAMSQRACCRQLALAPAPIKWPTPYVTDAAITAASS